MSFNISDFTTAMNDAGGIAKNNKFKLYVAPPPILLTQYKSTPRIARHFVYSVQNASIPTKTISTNSVLAPGSEQKYPYAHEMEDFSVTFLCSRDYIERKFIDDWMMEVVKPHGGSFTIGYRNEYSGSLQLMVYGADGQKPVDVIKFNACFPLSAGAVELSYDEQGEIPTFEVVFQIDYWERIPLSHLPEEHEWDQRKSTTQLLEEMAKRNETLIAPKTNPRSGNSVMGRMANNNFKTDMLEKNPIRAAAHQFRTSKGNISSKLSRFERAKSTLTSGYKSLKKYL